MEFKQQLVKNLLNQHNLELERKKNKNYYHNQKIKQLDKEIKGKISLVEQSKNQIQILEDEKIIIKNKLKSFHNNLDKIPNFESNILKIHSDLDDLRKQKLTLAEELDDLKNNSENNINKLIVSKKNEIDGYTNILHQLNKNYQISQQKISQEKETLQEEFQKFQIELETLRVEFKLHGNVRLQDRNINIQNMIQFKNTNHLLNKEISSLKNELEEKKISLEKYIISRKEDYQKLLVKNNYIMKNTLNPTKVKNVYQECKNLQEQHQMTTDKEIKKINDSIKIIDFSLIQKTLAIAKIKKTQKNKTKIHENTLQKIKKIKSNMTHLNLKFKILLIREESNQKQYQEKYKNIDVLIENLKDEIENYSLNNPEFREKVKEILDLGMKIKLSKKEKEYYEKEIKNTQVSNEKLILHFHHDLKKIDIEIKNINKTINTLENKKNLLLDKKNFLEKKHKNSHQKYIKENNKSLLQELSSLSNLIT